jgi:hypothetical protein
MEQLTLEQSATNYAPLNAQKKERNAFKAGAKWQYEQSKELINIMQQLLSAYDFRYPNEHQLLVGYTNTQAFEKINTLIQNLHDQY